MCLFCGHYPISPISRPPHASAKKFSYQSSKIWFCALMNRIPMPKIIFRWAKRTFSITKQILCHKDKTIQQLWTEVEPLTPQRPVSTEKNLSGVQHTEQDIQVHRSSNTSQDIVLSSNRARWYPGALRCMSRRGKCLKVLPPAPPLPPPAPSATCPKRGKVVQEALRTQST